MYRTYFNSTLVSTYNFRIYNWPLQPFTPFMLCIIILYISVISVLEKPFVSTLFTLRVLDSNLLRGIGEEIIFVYLFECQAWISSLGFTSNMPTDYLLDPGGIVAFEPFFILLCSHYNAGTWIEFILIQHKDCNIIFYSLNALYIIF